MRAATLRRNRAQPEPGVAGTARLERDPARLARRLRPGDVAVIDQLDLDRRTAQDLITAGAAAVVNAAASISGRYPNLGPQLLVQAGVPLLDDVGAAVFGAVRDGAAVRLDGEVLYAADGRELARGRRREEADVAAAMAGARRGLSAQLDAFAGSTAELLRAPADEYLERVGAPPLRTWLAGRDVVVVSRGYHHDEDVAALRRYLAEARPVLVGVDAGADVLLDAGLTPDLVLGDLTSVSARALTCGAELVAVEPVGVGTPAGAVRAQELGRPVTVVRAAGAAADVALLLADEGDARLVVRAGGPRTLVELLDSGHDAMASAVLARLRLAGRVLDAPAVAAVHRPRISALSLLLLVLAALAVMAAVVLVSPVTDLYATAARVRWHELARWVQGVVP